MTAPEICLANEHAHNMSLGKRETDEYLECHLKCITEIQAMTLRNFQRECIQQLMYLLLSLTALIKTSELCSL